MLQGQFLVGPAGLCFLALNAARPGTISNGALAHLGERSHGMRKVVGAKPTSSI